MLLLSWGLKTQAMASQQGSLLATKENICFQVGFSQTASPLLPLPALPILHYILTPPHYSGFRVARLGAPRVC